VSSQRAKGEEGRWREEEEEREVVGELVVGEEEEVGSRE